MLSLASATFPICCENGNGKFETKKRDLELPKGEQGTGHRGNRSDAALQSKMRLRNRRTRSFIANEPAIPEFRANPSSLIDKTNGHSLLIPLALAADQEGEAIDELRRIEQQHRRWRMTKQSSREIARSHLVLLAEMVEQDVENVCSPALHQRLEELDALAQTLLWNRLRVASALPDDSSVVDWLANAPDPKLVVEAAKSAVLLMKGGDSADIDLALTVGELLDIFEASTGRRAVVGRQASETRVCQLAYAFFAIVEPNLGRNTIFNAIDLEQRHRRKQAKQAASD